MVAEQRTNFVTTTTNKFYIILNMKSSVDPGARHHSFFLNSEMNLALSHACGLHTESPVVKHQLRYYVQGSTDTFPKCHVTRK